MKNHSLLLLICLVVVSTANAEGGPSGKTLASTMDIYVFPKEAQAADQQSKDEASCYEWAAGNSGSDPFELQQQQVAQAEQQGEAKQQATAGQIENFKKAFSVCLEAKDYLVKY